MASAHGHEEDGKASMANTPNHNPVQPHQSGNGGKASSGIELSNIVRIFQSNGNGNMPRILQNLEAESRGMYVRALKALRQLKKPKRNANCLTEMYTTDGGW